MNTLKTISENQKRAMKTAIDYYTNPMFRNWYAVAHTNKYREGNMIVFSNQTETGAMYFKVMNHRKMLYIGMIYSDRIVNNYECIDYFTNPKVIKHATASFRKLGEMQENKIE